MSKESKIEGCKSLDAYDINLLRNQAELFGLSNRKESKLSLAEIQVLVSKLDEDRKLKFYGTLRFVEKYGSDATALRQILGKDESNTLVADLYELLKDADPFASGELSDKMKERQYHRAYLSFPPEIRRFNAYQQKLIPTPSISLDQIDSQFTDLNLQEKKEIVDSACLYAENLGLVGGFLDVYDSIDEKVKSQESWKEMASEALNKATSSIKFFSIVVGAVFGIAAIFGISAVIDIQKKSSELEEITQKYEAQYQRAKDLQSYLNNELDQTRNRSSSLIRVMQNIKNDEFTAQFEELPEIVSLGVSTNSGLGPWMEQTKPLINEIDRYLELESSDSIDLNDYRSLINFSSLRLRRKIYDLLGELLEHERQNFSEASENLNPNELQEKNVRQKASLEQVIRIWRKFEPTTYFNSRRTNAISSEIYSLLNSTPIEAAALSGPTGALAISIGSVNQLSDAKKIEASGVPQGDSSNKATRIAISSISHSQDLQMESLVFDAQIIKHLLMCKLLLKLNEEFEGGSQEHLLKEVEINAIAAENLLNDRNRKLGENRLSIYTPILFRSIVLMRTSKYEDAIKLLESDGEDNLNPESLSEYIYHHNLLAMGYLVQSQSSEISNQKKKEELLEKAEDRISKALQKGGTLLANPESIQQGRINLAELTELEIFLAKIALSSQQPISSKRKSDLFEDIKRLGRTPEGITLIHGKKIDEINIIGFKSFYTKLDPAEKTELQEVLGINPNS